MSGTKKRTLICILLIVLMIVIICYSGVRKYSSDITSREVASIEKQLDDLNGKSLGDDTRSYCHIKVIGESKGDDQDKKYFVLYQALEFYIADNNKLTDEVEDDDVSYPAVVYAEKKQDGIKVVGLDTAYDDDNERNEDFPLLLLKYAEMKSGSLRASDHYKADRERAYKELVEDRD